MKWNTSFYQRAAEWVLKEISSESSLVMPEAVDLQKQIEQALEDNFNQEAAIDQEVYKMMEDLEQQGHEFERYKMFPLVKNQLAKKKNFIL